MKNTDNIMAEFGLDSEPDIKTQEPISEEDIAAAEEYLERPENRILRNLVPSTEANKDLLCRFVGTLGNNIKQLAERHQELIHQADIDIYVANQKELNKIQTDIEYWDKTRYQRIEKQQLARADMMFKQALQQGLLDDHVRLEFGRERVVHDITPELTDMRRKNIESTKRVLALEAELKKIKGE